MKRSIAAVGMSRWVLAGALPICLAGTASADPLYTVTDLGDFGTPGGVDVSGMNDSGQVTGWFFPAFGEAEQGFITGPNGSGFTVIEGVSGIETDGIAVNNGGQVVGGTTVFGGVHAFITGDDGSGISDLGPGYAYGVNNSGQVVGTSNGQAFITAAGAGAMINLGTLGGTTSIAKGINDSGQVVGYSATASGLSHAFITGANGTGMQDLGVITTPEGYNESFATAINASGEVVGSLSNSGCGDCAGGAFITGPNGVDMRELTPNTGSTASGINAAGQVVGATYLPLGGSDAFVTGPNGVGLYNLNDLNLFTHVPADYLSAALAINTSGQILVGSVADVPVAPAEGGGYVSSYYLLTPNFATLNNFAGGSARNPASLPSSTPVGMIGGSVGGGASDFYEFVWNGGPFSASITLVGADPLDTFMFDLLNSNGMVMDAVLDSANDFTNSITDGLLAGTYAIGIDASGDDDPQFTIDFSTPVEGPAAAVPEPAALALFGSALAGLGLIRRRKRKSA